MAAFNDSRDEDLKEDEGGENAYMTSKEVLALLETAWLNEKFSPELLPHKQEMVECMMEQLTGMQDNLDKAAHNTMRICIHRLEIERIRFLLNSYLRERIHKIEHFCTDLLSRETSEQEEKMTQAELKFAKEYSSNQEDLMRKSVLNHMPKNLQDTTSQEMKVVANLDCYVFTRVNKSLQDVVVDEGVDEREGHTMDLVQGDQHLISYRPLRHLIHSQHVNLL